MKVSELISVLEELDGHDQIVIAVRTRHGDTDYLRATGDVYAAFVFDVEKAVVIDCDDTST